jgi:chromosome segregation ATPase
MSESAFEITILKAENVALKAELDEANQKLGSKSFDKDFIDHLKKDVFELEDELKTAEAAIKELKEANRQLQDNQMTREQQQKINHYPWMEEKLRDIQNGAQAKEIKGLNELLGKIRAVENETQRKYISEQTTSEQLRQEIKSLNGRLSSSYTSEIRDYWKKWFIAASIVLVFSLLMILGLLLRITYS